uniref:Uncharacterized protein n=1 Tax=Eutreptiella gymnastica TaxID=73025 RepID=A0A7S1N510_9EUGL
MGTSHELGSLPAKFLESKSWVRLWNSHLSPKNSICQLGPTYLWRDTHRNQRVSPEYAGDKKGLIHGLHRSPSGNALDISDVWLVAIVRGHPSTTDSVEITPSLSCFVARALLVHLRRNCTILRLDPH